MHTLHRHGMANLEIKLGHKVITDLTIRLDYKGHVIVVNNFFTSVAIFLQFGVPWNTCHQDNEIKLH